MTPRILLAESLDAPGSSPADARSRVDALAKAGFECEAVICDHGVVALPPASVDPAARAQSLRTASDAASFQAVLNLHHDHLVLVAASAPGGGVAASWIPPGVRARWWPSGLHGGKGALERRRGGGGVLRALDAAGDAPCATAGLSWTPIEGAGHGQRRLSPWDGDFVLVPAALSGAAGALAIRIFARIAEDLDALDLVFLDGERADLDREARRLGIRTRVHFAGPAPRRAEYAWCHTATAVLISCDESLSGGVPLRAMACGAPVLVLGAGSADEALRGWLDAAGCLVHAEGTGDLALAQTLERMIDRDRQVEQAVARGRDLATLHEAKALAGRLAAALRADPEARRRAA